MGRAVDWMGFALFAANVSLAHASPSHAEALTIVAYNVESGGAEAETVARVIEKLDDVDLWGFSELASEQWLETFRQAAEKANTAGYGAVIGTTGAYPQSDFVSDRLAMLYNQDTLELLGNRQLHAINDGKHRSPLVAEFRSKRSGTHFAVVLNHLASADAKLRVEQSWRLREWALSHHEPLILVGDFNYRWAIEASDGDPPRGFDALTRGGVLTWVKPDPLLATWCGGAANSIFDFAFVNAAARAWNGRSDVIETECAKSNQRTSDHRPVRVRFELPVPAPR